VHPLTSLFLSPDDFRDAFCVAGGVPLSAPVFLGPARRRIIVSGCAGPAAVPMVIVQANLPSRIRAATCWLATLAEAAKMRPNVATTTRGDGQH